jgi:hypothetical protein
MTHLETPGAASQEAVKGDQAAFTTQSPSRVAEIEALMGARDGQRAMQRLAGCPDNAHGNPHSDPALKSP